MSGPSRSQSIFSAAVSDDHTAPETQHHETTDPSEDSSVPATSSHGTSSPRTVLPAISPIPTPAPPQQGPHICHTARKQVVPTGTLPYRMRGQGTPSSAMGPPPFTLHPEDPYAASSTRVMDRYTWERLYGHSVQRNDGSGPSRPPTEVPSGRGLTPAQFQDLRNMAMDLRGLTEEAEHQAYLLFQVSDAAHRLSEHTIRVSSTAQSTSRTVQRLVSVCLVMGALLAIALFKMLLDFIR